MTIADENIELWLLLKQASEATKAAVISDVTTASEISEPELTVLVHLSQVGGISRQNALAAETGWDRTRLSHLLTRMEARGLVTRTRLPNGVSISLDAKGRDVVTQNRPVLAAAVETHFTHRLSTAEQIALREILEKLT